MDIVRELIKIAKTIDRQAYNIDTMGLTWDEYFKRDRTRMPTDFERTWSKLSDAAFEIRSFLKNLSELRGGNGIIGRNPDLSNDLMDLNDRIADWAKDQYRDYTSRFAGINFKPGIEDELLEFTYGLTGQADQYISELTEMAKTGAENTERIKSIIWMFKGLLSYCELYAKECGNYKAIMRDVDKEGAPIVE